MRETTASLEQALWAARHGRPPNSATTRGYRPGLSRQGAAAPARPQTGRISDGSTVLEWGRLGRSLLSEFFLIVGGSSRAKSSNKQHVAWEFSRSDGRASCWGPRFAASGARSGGGNVDTAAACSSMRSSVRDLCAAIAVGYNLRPRSSHGFCAHPIEKSSDSRVDCAGSVALGAALRRSARARLRRPARRTGDDVRLRVGQMTRSQLGRSLSWAACGRDVCAGIWIGRRDRHRRLMLEPHQPPELADRVGPTTSSPHPEIVSCEVIMRRAAVDGSRRPVIRRCAMGRSCRR